VCAVTGPRLLLFAATLLASAASGQAVLTPDDAVRHALARPDFIALLDADVLDADAGVIESRRWLNPTLHVGREAGDPTQGEPDEIGVMLSQTVALGQRRGLEREAARRGTDTAHAMAALRRAELRADVLRVYFAAVTANRHHAALVDAVDRLDRIARIAGARRDAGDLSGFEQRRIAQQVERARLRRDTAAADLALARAELAARTGVDAYAMEFPADAEVLPPRPAAMTTGSSAALHALAARREQADAALTAARRWQVPLTIGVGQKRFDGVVGRSDALLLELSVPLPLFDRNQAERQRAFAAWQRADADLRLAEQQAASRRAATEQRLLQRIDAAGRMESDLLPQARELARIAEASFAEGELDLTGLLAALDEEVNATQSALDTALSARHAAIEFELAYPHQTATGE
jgi:outer membrane protein, heavy metal efflux system